MSRTSSRACPFPRRTPERQGFTLVELMVAISGGLMVSVVVFVLARDATRFYQRESRIGDATLGTVIGFERLRADIARAGFLSTPNIRSDPLFCGGLAAALRQPGQLTRLASVRIISDDPNVADNPMLQDSENLITPDALVLAGNYQSADQFPMWGVARNSGQPPVVFLQTRIGPLARMGYFGPDLDDVAEQQNLLDSLFPPRRALRIVDEAGRVQFALIDGADPGSGNAPPSIRLNPLSVLSFRGAAASDCGVKDQELGVVNVVNIIRYDLSDLSGTTGGYAPLFTGPGQSPFNANRLELVRAELFADTQVGVDTPDPATVEVLVEHAVDLQFGITLAGTTFTTLRTLAPGNAGIGAAAGDTSTTATSTPQRIRAIRVRLSARSTVPDREADVDPESVAPGLYRIKVGDGEQPFARVRTLQADVALLNQAGVRW